MEVDKVRVSRITCDECGNVMHHYTRTGICKRCRERPCAAPGCQTIIVPRMVTGGYCRKHSKTKSRPVL